MTTQSFLFVCLTQQAFCNVVRFKSSYQSAISKQQHIDSRLLN